MKCPKVVLVCGALVMVATLASVGPASAELETGEAINVEGVEIELNDLTAVGPERVVGQREEVARGNELIRVSPVVEGSRWGGERITADAQMMLDSVASEGSLVDLSQLVLSETSSGLLVASSKDVELRKVTHEAKTLEQTFELASPTEHGSRRVTRRSSEEAMGVEAMQLEPDTPIYGVNVPLGPGSISLEGMTGNMCFTARGNRFHNIMNWCYNKRFVDGGDGRKSFGLSDDDGSNTEDFYAYRRWATTQPDLTPIRDYSVMETHVFSWPTWNTRFHRNSRTLDWTPTNGSCGTDGTFSVSGVGLSWSTPTCSSGTDISMTHTDGRMKHYYTCNICSGGTKNVGFHIGVAVRQGTIPYWHDDNYAAFRQTFTWTWDYIDS